MTDFEHICKALDDGIRFLLKYKRSPGDDAKMCTLLNKSAIIVQEISRLMGNSGAIGMASSSPDKSNVDQQSCSRESRTPLADGKHASQSPLPKPLSYASNHMRDSPEGVDISQERAQLLAFDEELELLNAGVDAPANPVDQHRNALLAFDDELMDLASDFVETEKVYSSNSAAKVTSDGCDNRLDSRGSNRGRNSIPGKSVASKRASSNNIARKMSVEHFPDEDSDSSCKIVGFGKEPVLPKSKRFKSLPNQSKLPSNMYAKKGVQWYLKKDWRNVVKDTKLKRKCIVEVDKIVKLPPGKITFSKGDLAKLNLFNTTVKQKASNKSGRDDALDKLLKMPKFDKSKGVTGSKNRGTNSAKPPQRSSEDSEQEDAGDFDIDQVSSIDKMSDDEFEIDEDDDELSNEEENDDEDDDYEEDFEEEGAKVKLSKGKAAAKSKGKQTSEIESDVQRLLRKRVGSAAGSKDSNCDSEDIAPRRSARKSLRKNPNVDSSSGNEDSDSDSGKVRRKKPRMDSSDSENLNEDSDVPTSKKSVRLTRSKSSTISKKSSRTVIVDDGSSCSEETEKKKKRHRRIKGLSELNPESQRAIKEEHERLRRIAERQKMYNQSILNMSMASTENADSLVLEVEESTGKPALQVNPNIARRLKTHQVEVVKFMWTTTCESLEQLRKRTEPGGGCIVAHCMGLGKTLSTISFIHTLIANRDITGVKTCLVLSPLNTVLNWQQEFGRWVPHDDEIDVREMSQVKQMKARADHMAAWLRDGGVMICGYEMFRRLTQDYKPNKALASPNKKPNVFHEALIQPGPDFVVCDEGHILKSSQSAISKLVNMINTKRRILLTGTPLQNNLFEYHCMVSFVKPNLLGTREEFANRFANPIKAGETKDSTPADERLMKRRISVLHRILQGCVHRRGYEHLSNVLPTKLEYVILLRLTPIQADLYCKYLTEIVGVKSTLKVTANEANSFRRRLFADYHTLRYVSTHPYLLLAAKLQKDQKEARDEMTNFLEEVDKEDASSDTTAEPEATSGSNDDCEVVEGDSSDDSVIMIGPDGEVLPKSGKAVVKQEAASSKPRSTRANKVDEEIAIPAAKVDWFLSLVDEEMAKQIEVSSKFIILMQLLRSFEAVGDKTLIFSQSLYFLDLLEEILHGEQKQRKAEYDEKRKADSKYKSDLLLTWEPDKDYFRIDGQVGAGSRSDLIKRFNSPSNTRARLFLISTRAGGLGINLIGANRVIITDVSWNPSNDLQALFRAYRFGQTKPVYVYRLVTAGTMEERIYDRQVLKQSMSQRVVDEQQILRHFSTKDICQLYEFDINENVVPETPRPQSALDSSLPLASDSTDPILPLAGSLDPDQPSSSEANSKETSSFSRFVVPKDRIFAEVLRKYPHVVKAYHDHDSLLAHQEDQNLDDTEKQAAWREYENEQKGIRLNAENPVLSHHTITATYQRDHRLSLPMAQYHALCYLRQELGMHPLVKDYVEQFMPYYEHLARTSQATQQQQQQERSQVMANEIALQERWAQQAQQLAANNGSASASEVLQQLMQQNLVPRRPAPSATDPTLQNQRAMAAIRQFAPYERDTMLNQQTASAAAAATSMSASASGASVLNSMMSQMLPQQRKPGGRVVAPPNRPIAPPRVPANQSQRPASQQPSQEPVNLSNSASNVQPGAASR